MGDGDGGSNGDGPNGEGSGNSGIGIDGGVSGAPPASADSSPVTDFAAAFGLSNFGLSPAFGAANLSTATPANLSFDGTVNSQGFAGPTGGLATAGLESAAVADSGLSFSTIAKGIAQGVLGLLGIVSATPQGVVGGALGLSNAFGTLGGGLSGAAPSSVAGDNGGNVSFGDGGNSFASVSSFGSGAVAAVGGAPVLAFNGVPASTSTAPASNGALSGLSGLLSGLVRPNTARYTPIQQPAPNPALLLALGVGAFFLIS